MTILGGQHHSFVASCPKAIPAYGVKTKNVFSKRQGSKRTWQFLLFILKKNKKTISPFSCSNIYFILSLVSWYCKYLTVKPFTSIRVIAKGALWTLMFFPVSLQSSVIIVQDLNCMFGVWDKAAFNLFSSGLKRNNEANGFHCILTLTSSGCFALSFSYKFTRGPLCVSPPVSSCHSSAAALWRKI